jgi:RNA polymerase sigma factor (TIGR02999 family)
MEKTIHDGSPSGGNEAMIAEIRRLVRRKISWSNRRATLQTTDWVHDVFLKVRRYEGLAETDRAAFLRLAATTVWHALADYLADKAPRKNQTWPSTDPAAPSGVPLETAIEVGRKLEQLSKFDPRAADVVRYRFFLDLTEEEVADVLGIARRTVQNDWKRARAWLRAKLEDFE